MQQTQTRANQSPKQSYFMNRAENWRRYLTEANEKLARFEGYVKQAKDVGKEPGTQLLNDLDYCRQRVAECRREVERALFNAGRA